MTINQASPFEVPAEYVLYIEGEKYPEVSKEIQQHYLLINHEFKSSEGKLLLYPNGILQHADSLKEEYAGLLRYHYPYFGNEQVGLEVKGFFNLVLEITNNASNLNHLTRGALNLPNGSGLPYFVTKTYNGNQYHYYEPSDLSPREWAFKIANLWRQDTLYNIDEPDEPRPYDPDDDIRFKQISWEAEKAIRKLGKAKAYNLMINLFGVLAKECGIGDQALQQLASQSPYLSKILMPKDIGDARPISRLVIDNQHRIFLPEYNSLEIKMPTLSKVVYFLFLRHPEGLLFKELVDYRQEVFDIYNLITNRSDRGEMIKSVNALLDPTSNSINEKCSRIKEAFVSAIDNDVASYYYITGDRGLPKRIILPEHMVEAPWR